MIRIVKLTFKQEHVQDFLNLFEERKQAIRKSKGCTQLSLWNHTTQSNIFYTYSIWNLPHDLELYRQSQLFSETWDNVKQWFDAPPEAFSANEITIV